MPTHVFLVRPGVTSLHLQGHVVGRQDVEMCKVGMVQAQQAVDALAGHDVAEVISSPLTRALQTANLFAQRYGIDTTRDQRLTAVCFGQWEGRPQEDLDTSADFRLFLDGQGRFGHESESLEQVDQRVRASIEQSMADNPGGSNIVVISHAIPLRLLLARYLGMSAADFARLELSPGSISVVRFDAYPKPAVQAINWRAKPLNEPSGQLA